MRVVRQQLNPGLEWGQLKEELTNPGLLEVDRDNWASEASPTLGCSIEISRDIIIY